MGEEQKRVKHVCPDKVGRFLVQVTKPYTYHKANFLAGKLKDYECKLFKICEDKYLVLRKVRPDDKPADIGHHFGEWQNDLLDVVNDTGLPEKAPGSRLLAGLRETVLDALVAEGAVKQFYLEKVLGMIGFDVEQERKYASWKRGVKP